MKVYLVYRGEYEQRDVDSIHASLESAQSVAHGHTPVWEDLGGDNQWCAWTRVHPAKKPQPVTFETRTVAVDAGVAVLPDGRIVETTAKFLDYPVLPEGVDLRYWPEWVESCDVSIVVREMHA